MRPFLVLAGLVALAALASATGPTCSPTCDVQVITGLFAPPVVAADNGAAVHWIPLGGIHTATADDGCFRVFVSSSPSVTFTNAAGVAHAGTVACENGVALPDGSIALAYHCDFHPEMHGIVVVRP